MMQARKPRPREARRLAPGNSWARRCQTSDGSGHLLTTQALAHMAPPLGLLAFSSFSLHTQRQLSPFSDPFYLLIYALIVCPPPWTVSSWEPQLCHLHYVPPAHCHTEGKTVGTPEWINGRAQVYLYSLKKKKFKKQM